MRSGTVGALLLGAVVLVGSACAPAPNATLVPTPLAQPGSPVATSSEGTTPPPTERPQYAVREDLTLLSLLPAEIDGAQVAVEPLGFEDALTSPDFLMSVESAAFLILVREPDLASGVVARIRPEYWSDAAFRSWRDSYDEGTCEPAGGVVGRAEARLGSQAVNITRCAGGVFVYHTFIQERGVVVSLFSWGEKRYGEQLMAGITP